MEPPFSSSLARVLPTAVMVIPPAPVMMAPVLVILLAVTVMLLAAMPPLEFNVLASRVTAPAEEMAGVAVRQAERGHPKNPAFLLNDGELPELAAPLAVLRSREGEVGL